MNADFLAKIMRFAHERGERMIVVDSHENNAFVILPFGEYESMVSGSASKLPSSALTKETGTDTISRENIDLPRIEPVVSAAAKVQEDWGGNELVNGEGERYYMEPLE